MTIQNKQDAKIVGMQVNIKTKISAIDMTLEETPKFKTPCHLTLYGEKLNFHTLSTDKLKEVQVMLNMHRMSAEALNISLTYKFSGFYIMDWMSDIATIINTRKLKKEREELEKALDEVDAMLSEEMKADRKLSDISAKLGI
ncbi:gp154 [Bacillus phage W.Ph.]|uniref:Gp154 n=1 Tax=Bacillus phage W.Ph. TaxID=764595 RepID=G9B1Q5_9CAUD|nr:gp154 [Bacillus phage W.Ph.]ADH03300.1 gp154 [Bacillus phage W.Ph.]